MSDRFRVEAERLRNGHSKADLVELALLLALEIADDVDEERVRAELDRLGALAIKALAGCRDAPARTDALLQLFSDQGFYGSQGKRGDPRTSLFHEALSRRTGIPIILSIIFVAVAARAGFALHGVGFPAHFLVRTATDPPLILDPYNGLRITEADCRSRARAALGPDIPYFSAMLRIATRLEVALRVVRNLKYVFEVGKDWLRAIDCCNRIVLLVPDDANEWRDRGNFWLKLDRAELAIADFERALALEPDAREAEELAKQIARLRA